MKTRTLILVVLFLNNIICLGQLVDVKTPKFPSYSSSSIGSTSYNNLYSQNKGGNTAKSIIEQQNRQNLKRMGYNAPLYTPNMTNEERKRENERYIKEELSKQKGYSIPNAQNKFNQVSNNQKRLESLKTLMNGVARLEHNIKNKNHYTSSEFKSDISRYESAKNSLQEMLEGSKQTSIKDALYEIETAYGNLHLSYAEYNSIISQSANFIKQWLLENGYDLKNQEALHLGVQKFLGDTLYIRGNKRIDQSIIQINQGHIPFYYDFVDIEAKQDFRNYFVTKALATGSGQCHTLPLVYLVLAEAIGAETYLSYSPNHSFIKYKNNRGTIVNYETTVDWNMSDQQYEKEIPTIAKGERNGLYLDTLGKQQIIASLLVELAHYYEKEHWVSNHLFINDCLNTSLKHFKRKYGGNAELYYIRTSILASELVQILDRLNITNLNEIVNHPEALEVYKRYLANEELITELGIHGIPEEQFNAMMERHDKKGKLQQSKDINTKSAKTLFFNH